jgi:hypothetical protein
MRWDCCRQRFQPLRWPIRKRNREVEPELSTGSRPRCVEQVIPTRPGSPCCCPPARRQGEPCPVHQSVESGMIGSLLDQDARPPTQLLHALVGDVPSPSGPVIDVLLSSPRDNPIPTAETDRAALPSGTLGARVGA